MAKEKGAIVIDASDLKAFSKKLEAVGRSFDGDTEKIKIRKVTLKDDLFLDVEYTEELPGFSKTDAKLSCTVPIHEDLKIAVQNLHPHLAVLCDDKKVSTIHEDLLIDDYFVKGFHVAGNEEDERATITGFKDVKHGKVNLLTPSVKYSTSDYRFKGDLAVTIAHAIYEVEQYLFHGKKAPDAQLEMDFPAGDEETGND